LLLRQCTTCRRHMTISADTSSVGGTSRWCNAAKHSNAFTRRAPAPTTNILNKHPAPKTLAQKLPLKAQ
jgi:hypothetical protein